MKVNFLGPIDRVTGSCTWFKDEVLNVEFLVDCGMRQGDVRADEWNKGKFPFDPKRIRFLVLTHAHLDHCGLIPRLYKEGFKGTVYCTRETAELTRINLVDASHQEGAPFKEKEVTAIKFFEPSARGLFGQAHPVSQDLFLGLFRNAHILGSCSVSIQWGPVSRPGEPRLQKSIAFSGDLGTCVEEHEHLPLLRHQMNPYPADYAVLESTYGDKVRPADEADFHARIERLRGHVEDTVLGKRGILVIPSFSIGRAQEILFDLHWLFASSGGRYNDVPVFFDAPMARKVSGVYLDALARTELTRKGVKFQWLSKMLWQRLGLDCEREDDREVMVHVLRQVLATEDTPPEVPAALEGRTGIVGQWRRIHRMFDGRANLLHQGEPFRPAILVTSSGMCTGGPILHYLPKLLPLDSTTVLLTGFQAGATPGAQLLQLVGMPHEQRAKLSGDLHWKASGRPAEERRIPLRTIRAGIEVLRGYSGHADQRGLVDWVFPEYQGARRRTGRTVFLNHGCGNRRRDLEGAIRSRGRELDLPVEVILPGENQGWFDLDRGEWVVDEVNEKEFLRAEVERLRRELARVQGQ